MSRCGDCPSWVREKCDENLAYDECVDMLQDVLYELSSRPQGKWITRSGLGITEIKCSVCGDKAFAPLRIDKTCELITRNFCPNCGAKMDKEK